MRLRRDGERERNGNEKWEAVGRKGGREGRRRNIGIAGSREKINARGSTANLRDDKAITGDCRGRDTVHAVGVSATNSPGRMMISFPFRGDDVKSARFHPLAL